MIWSSGRSLLAQYSTMAVLSFVAFFSLLLFILVPACILFYLHKPAHRPQRRNNNGQQHSMPLPPSPPGLPFLGHLHLLVGTLPHRALRSLAEQHGPVVLLRLGRTPTVVVSSAAGAEEVMRTRDLAFASRPASPMAARLLYGRDVAFAPYGEYWRQTRRVCVAHLLSARRVRSFRRVREQESAALVDSVRRRGSSSKDLGELLIAYANNVVSRAAFGDESSRGLFPDSDRGRRLRKVFTDFSQLLATEPVGELVPWLGWVDALTGLDRKVKRTFQALDAVLDKVIDDHRRRPTQDDDDDQRDFVDVLLDVSKDGSEYGVRLETDEIKAIVLDMFAGGTDTTTTAMEWAMAELVTHPRAMRRLQAEIRAAVGAAEQVTEEHLHVHALPYLRTVIKETFRLHPPVPLLVPRAPPADAEVLGYRVPSGTRVVVNAWAIGRDRATWGEDAEEFAPERLLVLGAVGVDYYRGQSFEMVPFGAGRRGCPGVGFAEQTIELALASLLYHFDWEPSDAPLDMSEMNGLAVHIKAGLPLRAKPWSP